MSSPIRRGAAILSIIWLAFGPAPARAADGDQETLVPADPWEVIHTARTFGEAEVARDRIGDPVIRVRPTDGAPYEIAFYGCRLGRDCTRILFSARFWRERWAEERLRPRKLAAWNGAKLIGRAWRDRDGRAVLEHPVVLAQGIPRKTLAATFEAWHKALAEYREYLGIPDG